MFRSIYFGKISKEKTERLLELYGKEGSFLTRDSESERGAYCLCVRRTPFVHTYKISQYHGGWAVKTPPGVKPQCFETLNDLIDCYRAAAPDSMAPLLHPLEKRLEVHIQDVELHTLFSGIYSKRNAVFKHTLLGTVASVYLGAFVILLVFCVWIQTLSFGK